MRCRHQRFPLPWRPYKESQMRSMRPITGTDVQGRPLLPRTLGAPYETATASRRLSSSPFQCRCLTLLPCSRAAVVLWADRLATIAT